MKSFLAVIVILAIIAVEASAEPGYKIYGQNKPSKPAKGTSSKDKPSKAQNQEKDKFWSTLAKDVTGKVVLGVVNTGGNALNAFVDYKTNQWTTPQYQQQQQFMPMLTPEMYQKMYEQQQQMIMQQQQMYQQMMYQQMMQQQMQQFPQMMQNPQMMQQMQQMNGGATVAANVQPATPAAAPAEVAAAPAAV